jgi:hypothetical protein
MLSCWSDQLEKPGALWDPFPFPEGNAHLLVKVSGEDQLTKFQDKIQWGKAQNQPNVGTAWLVTLDASSGMGSRYGEARAVAREFIEAMQPNDLMDVMIFDDRQVVRESKWKAYKDRNDLVATLNQQPGTMPSHGRDRPLFDQIKQMTADAFKALGNSDSPDTVPLHQAMVVLSNGSGRGDAASASPSADVFHQYLNQGRFPADNTSLPKTPLPVVSIWFPNRAGNLVNDIYKNNDAQFMQALANPEIGGFFDVVQDGQGTAKGKTIIGLVKARFNAMWIIHWRLSCMNPSIEQTFNLVFENTKPLITPDGSFKDVPIGIDPTEWPLDVDFDKTLNDAKANPIYPGGQFTVYGDFCWGGDKGRAESYFIPAGTKPNPQQQNTRDPELAKKAMQSLKAQNMVGTAVTTGDGYATFTVPDDDKVLEGSGNNMVARVVIYDNKAHRASAVDEKTVLTLKATKKPLYALLIGGIGGGVVVILLLVVVLMRGGGGSKRRAPPPPQGAPPPGYGAPPPQYGPPPGGGYNMGAAQDPRFAGAGAPDPRFAGAGAPDPFSATAQAGGGAGAAAVAAQPMFAMGAELPAPQAPLAAAPLTPADAAGGAPSVVQVTCPACQMMTMATPGQPSVCFSCGQPLPADVTRGGGGASAPAFPLTGGLPAQLLIPPPNPYTGASASAATLTLTSPQAGTPGAPSGSFTIRPGTEVRVGRDPAQCSVFLAEPRVSGVHATLKLEAWQLLVRDETSNNGTFVGGARIAPGTWTPVPAGTQLRFGPIEFNVQLQA